MDKTNANNFTVIFIENIIVKQQMIARLKFKGLK